MARESLGTAKKLKCRKCSGEEFNLFTQEQQGVPYREKHVLAKCIKCEGVYDFTITNVKSGAMKVDKLMNVLGSESTDKGQ